MPDSHLFCVCQESQICMLYLYHPSCHSCTRMHWYHLLWWVLMMMDTSLSLPQGGTPFVWIICRIFLVFRRWFIIVMARGCSWEIYVDNVEVGGGLASLMVNFVVWYQFSYCRPGLAGMAVKNKTNPPLFFAVLCENISSLSLLTIFSFPVDLWLCTSWRRLTSCFCLLNLWNNSSRLLLLVVEKLCRSCDVMLRMVNLLMRMHQFML